MAQKDGYWRRCAVVRVVDGDTVYLTVDLGYQVAVERDFRLLGVNAPEIFHGDEAEVARGQAARQFHAGWYADHAGHARDATNTSPRYPFLVGSEKSDKYGRFLGHVLCGAGHDLNAALVASGNAVAYMTPKGDW